MWLIVTIILKSIIKLSFPSDVLLDVIGKFADNVNNLQEMLREQKILNSIFQNTIEKLKDDNNKMATHIRELERTIESQKYAHIKCADHAPHGGAKHIQRPQEDPKIKARYESYC